MSRTVCCANQMWVHAGLFVPVNTQRNNKKPQRSHVLFGRQLLYWNICGLVVSTGTLTRQIDEMIFRDRRSAAEI